MIERASKTELRFILRVLLLKTIEGINVGPVRMFVKPYGISWIIFTLDLEMNSTLRKMVGIQMGLNCAPLVADFVFILLHTRFHDFS